MNDLTELSRVEEVCRSSTTINTIKENYRECGAHLTVRPGLLLVVWDGFPEEVTSEVSPLQTTRSLAFGLRPRHIAACPPPPAGPQPRRPACRPDGASRASPPRSCPCPRPAGSSRRPGACSRRRPKAAMRRQRRPGSRAAAGDPAHAQEAAVLAAAETLGPLRELGGWAHSDAAAIAIPASAAPRMLPQPGSTHHRAEAPGGQSGSAIQEDPP